ncbi:MAG: hypothetical protein FWH27_14990 [Planctomycetaceae bacterium]|nr:hypothetical protein [Planctomycetaceae bacterium]
MKKLTLAFIVIGLAFIPTLLMAQPPRPRPGQMPYGRPQTVQPSVRPTMQVHTPPRPAPIPSHSVYGPHRPPVVHTPVVRPHVIVVPQVVAPPVVAPYYPVYPGYYPPINSGFALTIGGKNGVFSIATGY